MLAGATRRDYKGKRGTHIDSVIVVGGIRTEDFVDCVLCSFHLCRLEVISFYLGIL